MLSYTGQRNYFGTLVNNTGTATLATADTLINDKRRVLLSSKNWWFLKKDFTFTTTAGGQYYTLQGDIDRIFSSPTVLVGSTRYTPVEVSSRDEWNRLNLTTYSTDFPQWWTQYTSSQIGIFPKSTTAGYTYTLNAKQKVVDLSVVDYTTGTIVTLANGGTAVTGAGTTWTAGMVGKWIKIAAGNAANLGDGLWYQISAVGSTTTLTLAQAYGGTSIAAGSATYTMGQMSILPEAYDSLPIYMALETYYTSIEPNAVQSDKYGESAKSLLVQMNADHSNATGGRVLDEGVGRSTPINPNLTVGF